MVGSQHLQLLFYNMNRMKNSRSLIAKSLLIAGIIVALYFLNSIDEGFQASTVVDLYFIKASNGAPVLVKSTNPGVTAQDANNTGLAGGTITLNIAPSLGILRDYTGMAWKSLAATRAVPSPPVTWQSLTFGPTSTVSNTVINCAKLDKASNALRIEANISGRDKLLHKPAGSTCAYTATILSSSTTEARLPLTHTLSSITIKGLDGAIFGIIDTQPGDGSNNNAKMRVQLTF